VESRLVDVLPNAISFLGQDCIDRVNRAICAGVDVPRGLWSEGHDIKGVELRKDRPLPRLGSKRSNEDIGESRFLELVNG
jgi:hypothetical protein